MVRRDPAWAHSNGWHQDALLCWDRDRITEEPYVFFVCQRNGVPHEPCERMIEMIFSNSMNRLAPAPGSYLERVERRERARAAADEQDCADRFENTFHNILDVPGRTQSIAGNSQRWTMDPTLEINRGQGW